MPQEITDPIPLDQDEQHAAYDKRVCPTVLADSDASRSPPQSLPRAFAAIALKWDTINQRKLWGDRPESV